MDTQTGSGISARVRNLRERVLNAQPGVCTERARIYTAVYRTHSAEPVVVKRAIAICETLKNMSIYIDEGELIVGNQSSKLRAAPIFPEYAVGWLLNEIDELDKRPGDRFYPSEEDKERIREICAFWKGKTLIEKGYALMPPLMREIHGAGIIRAEGNLTSGDAHIAVNFERLLFIGLEGYRELVQEQQEKLQLHLQEDLRKAQFLRAVLIALEGMEHFIGRFAELAFVLSHTEQNLDRKGELQSVHRACSRIKKHPPQTFHEALQLVYFVQLVLQIESNGHSLSLGRMDQYLYAFYRRDTDRGVLSRALAEELLECLWIKLYAVNKIRPWSHTRFSVGSPLYQNVTIGGQTPCGEDGVNELSFLILRTVGEMRLTQPNLSVRYHQGIQDDFLGACLQVIEKGFGMPAFNNDEIVIPALIELGVEPADAYNYSAIGCIEIAVPGKWGYRCTGMSFLNLMRVFLAALDNGRDPTSGQTFCQGSGTLEDFGSFDELMEAWRLQAEFYARATVAVDTAVDTALEEHVPDVLCSAFVDHCIERGKTLKEGGAKYDFISGPQVGIANLGNSLAAVKKLVFEERRIEPGRLMRLLRQNFEGAEGEAVRQMLINRAPKYGNDDDYVDLLLREAYTCFIDEIEKHHNTRYGRGPIGGGYFAGTSSISANVPAGATVCATPDGRRAFTPLAEGSSPAAGTDLCGPTAVYKSVAKLPTGRILGGVLLNQKMSPDALREESSKKKLLHLIRTFFNDLKGWHVQYNIVSAETLRDAQERPREHKNLVVRVAGYSAFFTTLAPEAQNDIIARTEHAL
jgi:pyruvate formate-lyase/glycerol dehydratase family glycyl radical enzyme